ncbi:MAG: acetyl-CoA carboxylase, biotin carboxyl carrier protein [Gammaproteobacteria bacterium RBG_16_51_14]|nr:MAG: acetyl-CoA carboxylase, biotin carboxyl carrier protein [Gammaproteobacteria bacterium RBG_16_51_14]
MDIRKVKKLIELLEESDVDEIEIHEGEESVRISRHSSVTPTQTIVHVPGSNLGQTAGGKPGAGFVETAAGSPEAEAGSLIKSPMVGIFYLSPSPEDHPFVEVGQSVKKGDVLCIIEAMKIMNQIESDVSGIVQRILVENGEPVEYGQLMFVIRET